MVVSEDAKKDVLSRANVVAVGHAQERVNDTKNGKETLTALVTQKKPETEIDDQDIVPKEVEATKTDIIEVGRVEIESDYPVRPGQIETETRDIETNQKHRPFPQGSSIGHPNITAGTAGLILWKRKEKEVGGDTIVYPEPYGYTNNHVAANENKAEIGDPILQPGPYDGGKQIDGEYAVGQLEGYVELKDEGNTVDGAWYSLKDEGMANSFVLGMGVPTEKADVSKGDILRKGNTRTTGYREGEVLMTDARVKVKFSDGVKEFEDQIITKSISRGGDSGSAVFDKHGKYAGNLFGGSSKVTIVNKAEHILEETPLYLNMEDVYDE